jgi:hypothetical protein
MVGEDKARFAEVLTRARISQAIGCNIRPRLERAF